MQSETAQVLRLLYCKLHTFITTNCGKRDYISGPEYVVEIAAEIASVSGLNRKLRQTNETIHTAAQTARSPQKAPSLYPLNSNVYFTFIYSTFLLAVKKRSFVIYNNIGLPFESWDDRYLRCLLIAASLICSLIDTFSICCLVVQSKFDCIWS